MRFLLTALLLGVSVAAWAQATQGVIVRSGDVEHSFAISAVREITFGDDGITVVTTSEATLEISGDWQLRFGEVEADAIVLAGQRDGEARVQVFNADGKLVRELDRLADLRLCDVPRGVCVVTCNGKSFKIKR